jgi:RNA polymerase sigma-70 factor (ECF subfamily)
VFETCYEPVLAYARRRSPTPDVADEVVSETFTTAWRRFEDVPEDALPWLYGVARRILANRYRGIRRRQALLGRLFIESSLKPPPEDPAELVSERDVLARALAALREEDRELLLLSSWEGLEPARAASSLGISTDAFTARLYRARRRLEMAIEKVDQPRTKSEDGGDE